VNDPVLIACAVVIFISATGLLILARPPRKCVNCGHRFSKHEGNKCRVRGDKVVVFAADFSQSTKQRTRCNCPGYDSGSG
jgi:hypothetical protein